jgi:transposase InsO family protein
LKWEFVYLAVVLNTFPRKAVGWELDKTLAVRLALAALNKALLERKPEPGLVHHSDRGLQNASSEYIDVLPDDSCRGSFGVGILRQCQLREFMKTLKREEIYANRYEDLGHMRVNIEEFIESITIGSGCTRR